MKKCFFFALALVLSLTALRAQNFHFVFDGDTLTAGDTVVYRYGAQQSDLEDREFMVVFGLLNGSDDTLTTQVIVEQVSQNTNFSVTSVCAGMCVEGSVSSPFDILAHELFNDIQAHFECRRPGSIMRGDSELFLVKTGNGADAHAKDAGGSFFLKIESAISSSGSIATACAAPLLRAYPNPARGEVAVAYELPAGVAAAELVVLNTLGQQVLAMPVSATAGEANISLQSLPQGLDLYGIRGEGYATTMKKLVVK